MSDVDMTTDFAVAIDKWQEATIDVLQEGACLAAGAISDDVRTSEVVRPMEVIRADLIHYLLSQSEARRAHHAPGRRAA